MCCLQLKEFKIVGRRRPTQNDKSPALVQMRIFAPDDVVAKSRFWYFISKLKKIKKSAGEVVSCQQVWYTSVSRFIVNWSETSCMKVFEKRPTRIKNIAVWLRYDSRSGTHNMYREYRDVTVCGAITQCCKQYIGSVLYVV